MDVSMIPVLMQRLDKLERSNRRLKLSGLIVLVGLACVRPDGSGQAAASDCRGARVRGEGRRRRGSRPARSLAFRGEPSPLSRRRAGESRRSRAGGARAPTSRFLIPPARSRGFSSSIRRRSVSTCLRSTRPVRPNLARVVFEVLNQGTGGFAFYDKNGVTRALVGRCQTTGRRSWSSKTPPASPPGRRHERSAAPL